MSGWFGPGYPGMMPPSGMQQAAFSGQNPYPGRPYQVATPFEGLPLPGGLPAQMAFQMFADPFIQRMMGNQGYFPGGFGQRNLYEQQRLYENLRRQRQVLGQAGALESFGVGQTLQGLGNLLGFQPDPGMTQRIGGMAASAAPFLAQMSPGLLAQMGGARGSPTLLGHGLLTHGQTMIDPVSGGVGLSADTVRTMTQGLYEDLYVRRDPAAMRGVRAHDIGDIVGDLSRRGMMGTGPLSSNQLAVRAFAQVQAQDPTRAASIRRDLGLTGMAGPGDTWQGPAGELEKLTTSGTVQDQMRRIDTGRIKQSVVKMSEAVGALKDVFGDAGAPNASIPTLLAALDSLSGGIQGIRDPKKVAIQVRQLSELARMTGTSFGDAAALNQHAGAYLVSQGLSPASSMDLTTHLQQGAFAYQQAGLARPGAWGVSNIQEHLQTSQAFYVGSMKSRMANRFGAALRLTEGTAARDLGADAGGFIQALREGQTTYGNNQSVFMDDAQMASLLQKGGLNSDTFLSMLAHRDANQEMVSRHNLGGLGMEYLHRDLRGRAGRYIGQSLSAPIAGLLRGASADDRARIESLLGHSIVSAHETLDPARSHDQEYVGRQTAAAMASALHGSNDPLAKTLLTTMEAGRGVNEELRQLGVLGAGAGTTFAVQSGQGMKSLWDLANQTSPRAIAQRAYAARWSQTVAGISQGVAGAVPSGAMATVAAALQNAGGAIWQNGAVTAHGKNFLAQALGGVHGATLDPALAPWLGKMQSAADILRQLDEDTAGKPLTPEQQRQRAEAVAAHAAGQAQVTGLINQGVFSVGPRLDRDLLDQVSKTTAEQRAGAAGLEKAMANGLPMGSAARQRRLGQGDTELDPQVEKTRKQLETGQKFTDALAGDEQFLRRLTTDAGGRGLLGRIKTFREHREALDKMAGDIGGGDLTNFALGIVQFSPEMAEKYGVQTEDELRGLARTKLQGFLGEQQGLAGALATKQQSMGDFRTMTAGEEQQLMTYSREQQTRDKIMSERKLASVTRYADKTIHVETRSGKKFTLDQTDRLAQEAAGLTEDEARKLADTTNRMADMDPARGKLREKYGINEGEASERGRELRKQQGEADVALKPQGDDAGGLKDLAKTEAELAKEADLDPRRVAIAGMSPAEMRESLGAQRWINQRMTERKGAADTPEQRQAMAAEAGKLAKKFTQHWTIRGWLRKDPNDEAGLAEAAASEGMTVAEAKEFRAQYAKTDKLRKLHDMSPEQLAAEGAKQTSVVVNFPDNLRISGSLSGKDFPTLKVEGVAAGAMPSVTNTKGIS